jgi:histidyl-tRNA synthetase
MFAGEDIPACGFSLGLERIIVVMTEREMFPANLTTSAADVLVASLGEEFLPDAVAVATDLRKHGIRVSLYPEAVTKPQKALVYADGQKIPVAILIGEDEHKNGVVTVRNLLTRNQEKPTRDNAADVVRAMLNS